MDFKNQLGKILSLLRVRNKIGGLEISDTDLRFAYFSGDALKTMALRLPVGIVENGDIKSYDLFIEALKNLRAQIPDDFGNKKTIDVIVTLSSVHIYTQVFSLPLIENDDLKEAVQLNIRMVSPLDLSQAYAGWQMINQDRNELKVEILSAFAQKAFVDILRNALTEAGFFALAVESGSLSLARLIREKGIGFKKEKPLLVLSVDDKGLKFLIIRLGYLNFEYFQSWKDIRANEAKEISWADFEEAIKRNLHQVLNFYGSHWQEPLTDVVIASNTLIEEISKVVKENFSLDVRELKLSFSQPLQREWYESVGGAVRGEVSRAEDEDINLFGVTVQEEFRRKEIVDFLGFWRVFIPSSLAVLLVFWGIGYTFLLDVNRSVESKSSLQLSEQQLAEIGTLSTEIKSFNASVALLSGVQKSLKPKTPVIDKITSLMNLNDIVPDRIYFQSEGQPVALSGETDSKDKIVGFKNALAADPLFTSVSLNLSDVKAQEKGFSFTLSFGVK